MKKVSIHIVVDFKEDKLSPWRARLQYGGATKVIGGQCKSRSENGLKAYAIKSSIKELKQRCSIEVFCEAGTFKDMVRSNQAPKELLEILSPISQLYYLADDDLPPIMKDLQGKLDQPEIE